MGGPEGGSWFVVICAPPWAQQPSQYLAPAAPVAGSISQPAVVSDVPSANTPHAVNDGVVDNAAVHTLTQVGGVMYAGGKFHSVQNPRRTTTLVRDNLFSFDVSTGQPTGWSPQVNGEVLRTFYVAPYLYVGGDFTAADGVQERLVRYHVASGTPTIDTTWNPQGITRPVSDLDYVDGRLIVAGAFNKRLVALDPDTGDNTNYLDLPITGSVKLNGAGPVEVWRIAVRPTAPGWSGSATSPPSAPPAAPAPSCSTSGRRPRRSPRGTTSRWSTTAGPTACAPSCATSTSAPTARTS